MTRRRKTFEERAGSPELWVAFQQHFIEGASYRVLGGLLGKRPQFAHKLAKSASLARDKDACRRAKASKKPGASYFDMINTVEKAYWLGLLYADGCISSMRTRKSVRLALKAEDLPLLSIFSSIFGREPKLRRPPKSKPIIRGKEVSSGDMYITIIANFYLVEALERLGLIGTKYTYEPERLEGALPKPFRGAFVLGYFDGNGHITTRKVDGRPRWSVCGPEAILHKLRSLILEGVPDLGSYRPVSSQSKPLLRVKPKDHSHRCSIMTLSGDGAVILDAWMRRLPTPCIDRKRVKTGR